MDSACDNTPFPAELLTWLWGGLPLGLLWTAPDRDVSLNAEARRLLGWARPTLPQAQWGKAFGLLDGDGLPVDKDHCPLRLSLRQLEFERTRMWIERPDGTRSEVAVWARPVLSAEMPLGTSVIAIEDQGWRQAEQQRSEDWLAALSHEVRGALNSLSLAAAIAQRTLPEERTQTRQHLDIVLRNANLVTRLLTDFVDAAKVNGRRGLMLHLEPLELGSSVAHAVRACGLPGPKHRLDVAVPDDVWIRADRDRFHQILSNLLHNALKYSTPGKLLLEAHQEGQRVVMSLTDEGPGIPRDGQARLFQRYGRLPSREEGSGLGLWICRELARHMGGEMWLMSDAGQPTTLFVALPVA
jgi:signal transduction histidine kinase